MRSHDENAARLALALGGRPEDWRAALMDAGGVPELLRRPAAATAGAGLPPRSLRALDVVRELAAEYAGATWQPGASYRGSYDVYAAFRWLAMRHHEEFHAVLLDNKHRLIRSICVTTGTLTASIVHPRDVYRPVILHAAAAVIFVHNHPSGDPAPSREDLEITRRLRDVGDVLGVRVLDHVVIGRDKYASFVDDGYW